MAQVFKTKLHFDNCPVDDATESQFGKLAKSMANHDGAYTASFALEAKFQAGLANLTKKEAIGLNSVHSSLLNELEALVLKAAAKGDDGGKIKTEAEVSKEN